MTKMAISRERHVRLWYVVFQVETVILSGQWPKSDGWKRRKWLFRLENVVEKWFSVTETIRWWRTANLVRLGKVRSGSRKNRQHQKISYLDPKSMKIGQFLMKYWPNSILANLWTWIWWCSAKNWSIFKLFGSKQLFLRPWAKFVFELLS